MGTFVEEAQAKAKQQVQLPEGYFMTWVELENQRRAMKRLISVLVIFFLSYLTFRAAMPAIVVLLDGPFALGANA